MKIKWLGIMMFDQDHFRDCLTAVVLAVVVFDTKGWVSKGTPYPPNPP